MARALGYRRILVPVGDNAESEKAMDLACRLAEGRHASITCVSVVEVPQLLPLDAYMVDEETRVHQLLERARAVADSYGVAFSPRMVRGREAARAILDQATATEAELIVIGAPRKERAGKGAAALGTTVEHVLKRATCRIMVIEATPQAASAPRRAAA
jgi:nucleotide-binding universal stress UspA family protein